MPTVIRLLQRQVKQTQRRQARQTTDLAYYRDKPVRYARERLRIEPTPKAIEIAESLLRPPYRTLVLSGHNCSKTHTASWLTSWWYDTHNPGVVITTAPTSRDVRRLLWKEIRMQRRKAGLGGFIGNEYPMLKSGPDHYAEGMTARIGESFQGRHDVSLFFVFDEAIGIPSIFWETTATQWKSEEGFAWLCLLNPTTQASQAYLEQQSGGWHVIQMSSLDHPNIAQQLRLEKPAIPQAVTVSQIEAALDTTCDPIPAADATLTDLCWPPLDADAYVAHTGRKRRWYRPGPIFEARWLGRWPSQGTNSVWSDAVWAAAVAQRPEVYYDGRPLYQQTCFDLTALPEIGCDVATHGEDYTSIACRWGKHVVHLERHNGWLEDQTAGTLKTLARELANLVNRLRSASNTPVRPEDIPVKIDGDGPGSGVISHKGEYKFLPVCASGTAIESANYPNRRSELWFTMPRLVRAGLCNLSLLPAAALKLLQQQVMAPVWAMDSLGRCVVEKKQETKKRLHGASPDEADCLAICYAISREVALPTMLDGPAKPDRPGYGSTRGHVQPRMQRRGLYGDRQ